MCIFCIILKKERDSHEENGTSHTKMCNNIDRPKNIGGKWKIEILYYIGRQNVHRFGELRRHIGDITESSLTKQLRELEADGFINRHDFKEVPPRVEYTLTELGKSFMSVLDVIKNWGDMNLKKNE